MNTLLRLAKIQRVFLQYGFNRHVIRKKRRILRALSYLNPWSYCDHGANRGESIYRGIITLGPVFVKFGQLLSTRQDLFPGDIIEALSKLQDKVPPFSGKQAKKIIETSLKKPITELFKSFEVNALASASIAQVHAAILHDGSDVVVKVLRPGIKKIIKKDIKVLYFIAGCINIFWKHAKRLRATELVTEYKQTITDEQDLGREAANASQLRRNFIDSDIMYVPKIYWQFVSKNVMVIERIYGVQISQIKTLKEKHTNMKKLAEHGVEIFFTQVFRDSFFHADMHPGNLFVNIEDPKNPVYMGIDFGIMGTLSPDDLHYLAENLLAFFNRDYRRVATLHIESGWVPSDTRIDQFESAIRTVSEPIFEKPLQDISFGQLLLRLFQTAERFHMEVQPQLMLLQKTLLNIESLGRQLYPNLDLWTTAKPFMEDFMKRRYGLKNLTKEFIENWPKSTEKLIQTPRVFYDVLNDMHERFIIKRSQEHFKPTKKPFKKTHIIALLIGIAIGSATVFIMMH